MPKKHTQSEFIAAARKAFPRTFGYSRVKYVNTSTKVEIQCRKHGPFHVTPNQFFRSKYGCPKCGVEARVAGQFLTTDQFVKRARTVHGAKYGYAHTTYHSMREPVTITCRSHGDFAQPASSHLAGHGCPECAKDITRQKRKLPVARFVEEATRVHGGKYDYSKVQYVNNRTAVEIICPVHGSFFQAPGPHKDRGQGCRHCRSDKLSQRFRKDEQWFQTRSETVHESKYDYSRVDYVNQYSKVTILCKTHGAFEQSPTDHLSGCGCPTCGLEKLREKFSLGKKEFIKRAKKIHGSKYDYSHVEYVNSKTPVEIRCKKHGPFAQTPEKHCLMARGCWACAESKGERQIAKWLKNNRFTFEREKQFGGLRDKLPLRFDFCLPDERVLIEFDGEQHFTPFEFFGGHAKLKDTQRRDEIKTKWACKNEWRLIRVRFDDDVEAKLQQALAGDTS